MEVSDANDEHLWQVCRRLPSDFEPYGPRKREGTRKDAPDCGTCRFFQPLLRPGQLDWGVCANAQSPRAGLLTFWEQGCGQFEQEHEPGTEETRRNRSEFKDRVEDILDEALFTYADLKTAQANEPVALAAANQAYDPLPPKCDYWMWYWDNTLDRLLNLLRNIVSREEKFDARKAAEEMASEIRHRSDIDRRWRLARDSVARAIQCDVSAIRVPEDASREDKFWQRVEEAINEQEQVDIHGQL